MSVAIDIDGFGGGEWEAGRRSGERVLGRPGTRRQVDTRRPGGRPVSYDGSRVRVSRAAHVPPAQDVGWAAVVVGMLATALVVAGLFGLAQWRSGSDVATATEVVRVHPGESLGDVAGRVVPGAPVDRVVERIVELNALGGSGLHPGQTLIVPVSVTG